MTYKKASPKWDWRRFLTENESETLLKAEVAKRDWMTLNKERASITNRAIQRAKYHAQKDTPHDR